jgi:DNA-binding GntR family transcriptional regulator
MRFHLAAGKAIKLMAPYSLQRVNRLGLRALRCRSDQADKPDDCSGVVEQHQFFASALTGKNPERAAREAWLHIETFGRELMSLMRDENNA